MCTKRSTPTAAPATRRAKVDELERATNEVRAAQQTLLRPERLAPVGHAAGLAHEIGHPIARRLARGALGSMDSEGRLPFELRMLAAYEADVLTALGRFFIDSDLSRADQARSRQPGADTFVPIHSLSHGVPFPN